MITILCLGVPATELAAVMRARIAVIPVFGSDAPGRKGSVLRGFRSRLYWAGARRWACQSNTLLIVNGPASAHRSIRQARSKRPDLSPAVFLDSTADLRGLLEEILGP